MFKRRAGTGLVLSVFVSHNDLESKSVSMKTSVKLSLLVTARARRHQHRAWFPISNSQQGDSQMANLFTNVETTFSSQDVIESPQLFTNPRSKAHSRTNRATIVLFAAFLILAGASPARAQVFTKNQRILMNASPATIGLYYD